MRGAIKRRTLRILPMTRLAVSMMFHDRSKLAGTLLGVVFATVLMIQQLGVFGGLLYKNSQFVDNTVADLWVVPPETTAALPGPPISMSNLARVRTHEGVAWAERVKRPGGGQEAVSLVGVTLPRQAGGPFSMVAGSPEVLQDPDTVIVDEGARENLGNVNLGSVRELGGRRVVVRGFTWGLLPFGPGYAFANDTTARGILRIPMDQTSFVLVGLQDDADPEAVRDTLKHALGEGVDVYTKDQFSSIITGDLIRAQLGITFGTSTAFALIVGFVIVALSMFSAVVDNVKEFGTLKAMGTTNLDLAKLLFVQALLYAFLGTTIGLFLATGMASGIRSANLVLVLPGWLWIAAYGVMGVICVVASALAILRVRNIEPGLVFR